MATGTGPALPTQIAAVRVLNREHPPVRRGHGPRCPGWRRAPRPSPASACGHWKGPPAPA